MSLRGYITALEDENKMLREFWSTLGMPKFEYDCLGTEFTHSKKRREDFLRKFAEEFEEWCRETKANV